MKTIILVIVSVFIVLLSGCGSFSSNQNEKVSGFSFIEGTVIEIFGNKVIVELDDKDIVVGDSYENKLTNKIIKSSFFIIGMDTNIGREKAKVSDIRDKQVTFIVKNTRLKSNDKVKIYIPKKTIAIMDFSLLGMEASDIKHIAMEDMTTKMVQSGQYIVVERTKLDTILKEQELASSGLLDESSAAKVGKLVSADIILTGSFAKRGNKWNINLRLVDVTTGIIISAINEKIGADEFRPQQAKDSSNLTENFEGEKLSKGWLRNLVNREGSKSKASIDKTNGANGTSSSLRIDYFLANQESVTSFINRHLRDLSGFKGVKFYAKSSSSSATLSIVLFDRNFDENYKNKWAKPITIDNKWKEYKVRFNQLMYMKYFSKRNPGGDRALDLDNVELIVFGIIGKLNSTEEKKTLWIDEITLY